MAGTDHRRIGDLSRCGGTGTWQFRHAGILRQHLRRTAPARLGGQRDCHAGLGQQDLYRLQRPQWLRRNPGTECAGGCTGPFVHGQDRRGRPFRGGHAGARQIVRYQLAGSVDSFVDIAGAYRGLRSCGTYPFNVVTSSCGQYGLSIGSPMLNGIADQRLGSRMYSIKSWMDQVVCLTGVCTVGGVHASQITGENAGYTDATGHFGLLTDTAATQANLIQSSAVGKSKFREASAVWTNCQTRRCGNCSAAITAGCSLATSVIRCLTEPAMIGSGSSHVRRASRTSCSGDGCCPRHHWKTP